MPNSNDTAVETQGAQPTPWRKLELPTPNLEPILRKIQSFVEKLKAVIELITGLVEMILNFLAALADPIAALIREILDQIRELLEKYLTDAGLFALYVPFAKRMMYSAGGTSKDLTGNFSWSFKQPVVGASENTSVSIFNNKGGINDPLMTEDERQMLVQVNQGRGGNAGFLRTVAASLNDSRDHSRPQFMSEDDYIAAGVLVLGSDVDPFGFLDAVWKFKGLFGDLFAMSDGMPDLPRPKNLKAETILGPGWKNKPHGAKGDFQALLTWDSMNMPIHTIPDLGGVIVVPTRMAVIALKNNLGKVPSSTIVDLFGTRDITKGMTVGGATVVDERRFIPGETMFVASELETSRDDVWHFYIAWYLTGYNRTEDFAKAKGNELGYWYLSNAARVTPMQTASSGTPPDWVRIPSLADVLPSLAFVIRRLTALIEYFASYIPTAIEHFSKYIKFMRSEIQRYERLVTLIIDEVLAMIKLLDIKSLGGLYAHSYSGRGGNTYLMNEMRKSMSKGYPNAPPFFDGTEFVTGIVLVAGGAAANVEAATPLFDLLFGNGDDSYSAKQKELMDSLGDQVTLIEQVMSPEDAPPSDNLDGLKLCQRPAPPTIVFNANLEPL
jgi:hypothetical protein